MWVLQYLQYPNPAGLKPVKQDQYLRTVWDGARAAAEGAEGLDRITICYDPDANGVFRKSKDFVTGLNLASGFCIGNGGVYVVQPPYLLFYPDKNDDDVPDGDPEVLLTGFGMEDTHSLRQLAAVGAGRLALRRRTAAPVTVQDQEPREPEGRSIEFQQGIWRYHPKTKQFELFSEGGGNTYGLDFDKHGQVIAGTNWGGFAMLHQVQGGVLRQGLRKHGPLHNPHTYGYFDHVPYTGFKGGHVTCGGIVYQADAYPKEFRDQYIAGNLLSNAIYWHKLKRRRRRASRRATAATCSTRTTPGSARSICLLGPGRLRLRRRLVRQARRPPRPGRQLGQDQRPHLPHRVQGRAEVPRRSTCARRPRAELVELLKHPNKWWRNEARRLLADAAGHERPPEAAQVAARPRRGSSRSKRCGRCTRPAGGSNATSRASATTRTSTSARGRSGSSATTRSISEADARSAFVGIADGREEPRGASRSSRAPRGGSPRSRQSHSSMRSLENPLLSDDPQLPLLVWWAMEDANRRDTTDTVRFPYPTMHPKLADFFNERVARRLHVRRTSTRGTSRIARCSNWPRTAHGDINAGVCAASRRPSRRTR